MREIKFRAWDKELKQIFKVNSLEFSQWWVQCERPIDAPKENGNAFYGERNSFKNEKTDRHIIMQYTGLKDKNGIEIYEGDIVQDSEGNVFEITWQPYAAAWQLEDKKYHFLFFQRVIDLLKVVGNVYENPELLK